MRKERKNALEVLARVELEIAALDVLIRESGGLLTNDQHAAILGVWKFLLESREHRLQRVAEYSGKMRLDYKQVGGGLTGMSGVKGTIEWWVGYSLDADADGLYYSACRESTHDGSMGGLAICIKPGTGRPEYKEFKTRAAAKRAAIRKATALAKKYAPKKPRARKGA